MTTHRLIAGLVLALVMLAVSYDPRECADGTVCEASHGR